VAHYSGVARFPFGVSLNGAQLPCFGCVWVICVRREVYGAGVFIGFGPLWVIFSGLGQGYALR